MKQTSTVKHDHTYNPLVIINGWVEVWEQEAENQASIKERRG